jgi:hypothetical protein
VPYCSYRVGHQFFRKDTIVLTVKKNIWITHGESLQNYYWYDGEPASCDGRFCGMGTPFHWFNQEHQDKQLMALILEQFKKYKYNRWDVAETVVKCLANVTYIEDQKAPKTQVILLNSVRFNPRHGYHMEKKL